MFLRSAQVVRSVKLLTVCKEEFSFRMLHVITGAQKNSLLSFRKVFSGLLWLNCSFS